MTQTCLFLSNNINKKKIEFKYKFVNDIPKYAFVEGNRNLI